MFGKEILQSFVRAADLLLNQNVDHGMASTGVRVLNFTTKDGHHFSALEQNPDKNSTAAKLVREGQKVALIRQNDAPIGEYALKGFVVPDRKLFAAFQSGGLGAPEEINIDEIKTDVGEIKATNSNAFQGRSQTEPGATQAPGQQGRTGQGGQSQGRRDIFDVRGDDKRAA